MSWRLFLLLFIAACFFLAPVALTGMEVYDEGIRLHGAERVMLGDVPYHDFYALYGPAAFYWPAALFKVFGTHLFPVRMGLVFWNALAATAVFAFCRKMDVSRAGASIAFALFLLPRTQQFTDLLACDPSLSLILWAGVLMIDRTAKWTSFAIGLLVGLAALFRHDFGVYGSFAVIMACCVRESIRFELPSLKKALAEIAWVFLGILLTAGVVYGTLALLDWRAVLTNLVTYPAKATYYRRRPFPWRAARAEFRAIHWRVSLWTVMPMFRLLVYLAPFGIATVGLPLAAVGLWQRLLLMPKRRAGLAFLIFLIPGFILYGLGRSDWSHLFPLYAVSVPLLTILIEWFGSHILSKPGARRVYQSVAVFTCGLAFLIGVATLNQYLKRPPVPLDRSSHIVLDKPNNNWLVDAVKDLRLETGPVFVASERHDRVLVNPIILYFMAARPSATYFYEFDPGITTTEEVQKRIVSDLERNSVKTIFVWRPPETNEPNLSSTSSGVYVLDSYIANKYEEVKSEKMYRILKRRA
jgi:4-amino-4-deoxy-L-arabinose transferase-like glycosyltransferase